MMAKATRRRSPRDAALMTNGYHGGAKDIPGDDPQGFSSVVKFRDPVFLSVTCAERRAALGFPRETEIVAVSEGAKSGNYRGNCSTG